MEGSAESLPNSQSSLASTMADSLSSDRWQSPEAADVGNHADAADANENNEIEASMAETDVFEDGEASRARGELEVVDVNLSGRAQRRLARHARRARIPLVSRALVVEDGSEIGEP